jgi:hypothetical protein
MLSTRIFQTLIPVLFLNKESIKILNCIACLLLLAAPRLLSHPKGGIEIMIDQESWERGCWELVRAMHLSGKLQQSFNFYYYLVQNVTNVGEHAYKAIPDLNRPAPFNSKQPQILSLLPF